MKDTLKAGHYLNDSNLVKLMVESGNDIIEELDSYCTCFLKMVIITDFFKRQAILKADI